MSIIIGIAAVVAALLALTVVTGVVLQILGEFINALSRIAPLWLILLAIIGVAVLCLVMGVGE